MRFIIRVNKFTALRNERKKKANTCAKSNFFKVEALLYNIILVSVIQYSYWLYSIKLLEANGQDRSIAV